MLADWPDWIVPRSNTPLSAVIVCGTESLLIQTTVVPADTVNWAGTKAKFEMLTIITLGRAGGAKGTCTDADGTLDGIAVGRIVGPAVGVAVTDKAELGISVADGESDCWVQPKSSNADKKMTINFNITVRLCF